MKSLSDRMSENLEQMTELQTQVAILEEQVAHYEQHAKAADPILGAIDLLLANEKITESAEKAGIDPKAWIVTEICKLIGPQTLLRVDEDVYGMFKELAESQGLTLDEWTQSGAVTEVFKHLVANRYI